MELPYELVEKSAHPDDLRTTEYLRLNPNGLIPTLVDGEFVLWDSLAINLYLAQKYEGPMHAGTPQVVALAAQWSFWAVSEIEELCQELLHHRVRLSEFAREASHAERAELLLQKPLRVLNGTLVGREHLLGNDFTVADLNVSVMLARARTAQMDFSSVPEVERWLDACLARPAHLRVRDMRKLD